MARSSREHAVAVQLLELAADDVRVVERVRPLRMARELRDLPGRQVREDAGGELPALGLQPRDLVLDVHFGVGADVLQLLDLRFELGDRLFEIQEGDGHCVPEVCLQKRGEVKGWRGGYAARRARLRKAREALRACGRAEPP